MKTETTTTQSSSSKGQERLAFSVGEVASALGISKPTVYRLLQRGLLKTSKALRHKLVPRSELERFLKETL